MRYNTFEISPHPTFGSSKLQRCPGLFELCNVCFVSIKMLFEDFNIFERIISQILQLKIYFLEGHIKRFCYSLVQRLKYTSEL